jgi:sugar phosphate isomerase/epimerase
MEHLLRGGDDAERFAAARRLGFDGVEVCVRRSELRAANRAKLENLKRAKTAGGLAIPSLVLMEHNNGGIASDDVATARAAREDFSQCIEWAAELGAAVILVPFFGKGEITTEAGFARAANAFRELCPTAQKRGVALCYEGTHSAADIRRMAESVGSPAFGCYFDLANVVWRGMDTATEVRGLGRLVRQVHMKETRVGPGDCRPGLGRVNYAESASALKETGYDGWIVMETPAGPPELVRRDMSFTRTVFPALKSREPWPVLGAFSYGFERGDLDKLADGFRRCGLSCVQIGGALMEEAFDNPDKVRSRLESNGISIIGIAGYRNLTSPDAKKRAANIEYLKRCLEIAPRLGTSIVATETGTRHPESDWTAVPENWGTEAWDSMCDALSQLLAVAEKHGSILALEGYVNNVLATHGQLIGLLEKFPTEHLQVMLDPFNYLSKPLLPVSERITREFLDRFESRFVLAHLKDVGAEGAEKDTPEFGHGVFPFPPYIEFLRTRRPDLPLVLEHLPFDHIPAAIERLKKML